MKIFFATILISSTFALPTLSYSETTEPAPDHYDNQWNPTDLQQGDHCLNGCPKLNNNQARLFEYTKDAQKTSQSESPGAR